VRLGILAAWRHRSYTAWALVASLLCGCGAVPAPPSDVVLAHQQFEWNGRQVRVESYRPNDERSVRSTVFLLHGIGGIPGDGALLRSFAVDLARAGHEAVVVRYFDATGHWVVTRGIATQQAPEWRKVLTAIMNDRAKNFPDRSQTVLGYSLGGFLAIALAAEDVSLSALVVLNAGVLPEHEARDFSALPPTLILHGTSDTIVEPRLSERLVQLVKAAGVGAKRVLLDAEGHALTADGKTRASRMAVEFFSNHLRTGQNAGDDLRSETLD